MPRRRHQEEHENHERWLVSYADFITLLFAFFVVMYSISSVNDGKYKILSESLTGVFNQSDRSIAPIPVGEERPRTIEPEGSTPSDTEPHASADSLESISNLVQKAFAGLIESDQLTLRGHETWIEIELNSSLLFSSGDAVPNAQAFVIVERLAKILAPFDNPVRVEGFTDNLPIKTLQYPTNWELSSARAASIVRLLVGDGVNPGRLSVVGYGEHQPIADNTTLEGRARNRRVVLVVSRHLENNRENTRLSAQGASGTQSAEVDQRVAQ